MAGETTSLLNGENRNTFPDPFPTHNLTYRSQLKAIINSSYVNVLLLFVPLGIISGILEWGAISTFILNFLAIIPLAAVLGYATEEIATYVGETLGSLINATFGNAVELIVAIVALKSGQIVIVQSTMLGSILSNMLLVLGCCFFIGGIRYKTQSFNMTAAQTMSSLMAVACSSLLIPAAFHATTPDSIKSDNKLIELSRGTSIVLLIIYVFYLFFQLKTHKELFQAQEAAPEPSTLTLRTAIILLIAVTLIVSLSADYLVDSIDSLVETTGISKTFIGLILIPIVGNAAEHVTSVMVAAKNKMDLAVGIAVGSSMQIALFLTPFCVITGWIMGQPMTLFFSTFETAILFVSVLITNYLIQDGESNWLEGVMLLGTYIIIAIAFFLLPPGAIDA